MGAAGSSCGQTDLAVHEEIVMGMNFEEEVVTEINTHTERERV